MPKLKNIETTIEYVVALTPVWTAGMWMCGDQNFTDIDHSQYEAIEDVPTWIPISPVMFYMAFKVSEMIAIKSSDDPLVKEFYARYMIAYEKNEPIDPKLVSVQEGLSYSAAPVSPGPGAGILASTDRIAQISAGIPQ